MADGDKLPTIGEWLSNWLGVQLPSPRMPQTFKNLDKAVGKTVLASGENLAARIKTNTDKVRARGEIFVDGMFHTAEEERKLRNRAETTKVAIEELERDPPKEDAKEEIADDWLNMFARIAEDKSSAEMQQLFGRILAGEVRKPGSFSLRTIQIMSTVSTRDAEEITKYLAFVVDHGMVPYVEIGGPKHTLRLLMNELGIAGQSGRMSGSSINHMMETNSDKFLLFSGYGIRITNESAFTLNFSIMGQVLTTSGRELIPIARLPDSNVDFVNRVANMIYSDLKKQHLAEVEAGNIIVESMKMVERTQTEFHFHALGAAPFQFEGVDVP